MTNLNNQFPKIINCLNIRSGGGLILLDLFLKQLNNVDIIYVDPIGKNFKSIFKSYFLYKKSNFINNFLTYFKIRDDKKYEIFFYNGLAPIYKSRYKSYLVFHNANIFNSNNSLDWFFSKDFLRHIYFKFFSKNVDTFIVFTNHAKKILINHSINKNKILFLDISKSIKINKMGNLKKNIDFIYPASELSHKNHVTLIKAWVELSKKNIRPSLQLTIPNDCSLFKYINKLKKKYNLKIHNKVFSYKDLNIKYNSSRALIYPSLNETLGIPLFEARSIDLPILCSKNLINIIDYNKVVYFDPLNYQSISNSIIKHLDFIK